MNIMNHSLIGMKPIAYVDNNLHTINRNLNQLKIDCICIKSDITLIKEYIKKIEKIEEDNRLISLKNLDEASQRAKESWFWT